jgi:hypothetical protein
MRLRYYIYPLLLLLCLRLSAQQEELLITGQVTEKISGRPVEGARIRLSGTAWMTLSGPDGTFRLLLPGRQVYQLNVAHLSYHTTTRELKRGTSDTLQVNIALTYKSQLLDTIPVLARPLPETLVGKPGYSIYDFDFYEDKLILLTAEHSLKRAQLQLADYQGRIFSYYNLPRAGGEPLRFFRDYEGYTELICRDTVLRLDVFHNELIVGALSRRDFERYLQPVADTLQDHLYYSNHWDKYPSFSYYSLKKGDSLSQLLSTVTNHELMDLYRFQYYYLPSGQQLEARRLAKHYKADKHVVAALMSGFTQSMFYEPLYAPLFIMNDTICLFNHHNNHLYHYDRQRQLIDSIPISYHHPQNWREWKKQLYVDEPENKVYAFFSRNGRHYLKQIHHQTGREIRTYKLQHHSAEKIKIRDGYVYYVYRPFGSTQQKFLYREKIH